MYLTPFLAGRARKGPAPVRLSVTKSMVPSHLFILAQLGNSSL